MVLRARVDNLFALKIISIYHGAYKKTLATVVSYQFKNEVHFGKYERTAK